MLWWLYIFKSYYYLNAYKILHKEQNSFSLNVYFYSPNVYFYSLNLGLIMT